MSTPLITRQEAYADLRDRSPAARPAEEDLAERTWLNPLERITRWHRPCQSVASVGIDELTVRTCRAGMSAAQDGRTR